MAIIAIALGVAAWVAWYLGFLGRLPTPFAPWLALGLALSAVAVGIADLVMHAGLWLLALLGLALGLLYAVPLLWHVGGALYWNILHVGS